MSKTQFDIQGQVAIIKMDNPPVNSFGFEQRQEISSHLDKAEADQNIKAIIIIGSDNLFSGGADITEFGSSKSFIQPDLRVLIRQIESSTKPVIAAIGGTAFGGGLELPLGCHYRVAKPDASVGLPEVKIGIIPGAGGTQKLPRIIGFEKAINMIVSGNPKTALELKDTPLFDEIIEGDLLEGALKFANKIIDQGGPLKLVKDIKVRDPNGEPLIAYAKNIINAISKNYNGPLKCLEAIEAVQNKSFEEGMKIEADIIQNLFLTPESGALRHLFFAERAAAKIPDVPADTPRRKIEKVAVIGAGTMGGGITMAFLNAGFPVTLVEVTKEALDKGLATIEKNYMSSLQKGKFTVEQLMHIKSQLKPTISFDDVKEADLIIEAVFEDTKLKEEIFKTLDGVAKPGAILASNTSTLDINKIARVTRRPQDVLGMHFFSPANIMKLLEVVRGSETGKDVLATVMDISKKIKKVGVIAGVCDGFIGNRMIGRYSAAAMELLYQGVSPQQIDTALEKWGMAMGPYRMGDMAGNDVGWLIRKRHYAENPDLKHDIIGDKICELGRFGQKTGAGFYRYEPGARDPIPDPIVEKIIDDARKELGIKPRKITDKEIIERCIYTLINEGAKILEEGIALRASDIDVIYIYGYGFPPYRGGPMFYADTVTPYEVLRTLKRFAAEPGSNKEFWKPAPLLEELVKTGKNFN